MASISAEAEALEFNPSRLPPALRHAWQPANSYCPTAPEGLSGLTTPQKQPAKGITAMREPDRIIRLKTVLARTGLSRSTIYRKIAEGTFPAQLKISSNGTGWHESEISRWIADPVGWRRSGDEEVP